MNIDLHIEELILFGFAPGDRQRITEAVQEELARLLTDTKLPKTLEQGGEYPLFNAESFTVMIDERPETVGTRIGQAVYAGMAGHEAED